MVDVVVAGSFDQIDEDEGDYYCATTSLDNIIVH